MSEVFHCLYQIENKLNGKIYVGIHSTKNLNDNYFGSSKILKSDAHRKKIGLANKGNIRKDLFDYNINKKSYQIIFKDVTYPSIREAMRKTGKSQTYITKNSEIINRGG